LVAAGAALVAGMAWVLGRMMGRKAHPTGAAQG